jgi:hypothetical protein
MPLLEDVVYQSIFIREVQCKYVNLKNKQIFLFYFIKTCEYMYLCIVIDDDDDVFFLLSCLN